MNKNEIVCPHCDSKKIYMVLDIIGLRSINGNLYDVNVDLLSAIPSDLYFCCAKCKSVSHGANHEEWREIVNSTISSRIKDCDRYIHAIEDFISILRARDCGVSKKPTKRISLPNESFYCPACHSESIFKEVNLKVMLDINNDYALVSQPMEQDRCLICANCHSKSALFNQAGHCIHEVLWYQLSDYLMKVKWHTVSMDEFIKAAENYVYTLKYAKVLDKYNLFGNILYPMENKQNENMEMLMLEFTKFIHRLKNQTGSKIEYKFEVWVDGEYRKIKSARIPSANQ